MSSESVLPVSGRRYPLATALIVAAAAFMQILDSAIINTSLPQMARSFGVTTVGLSFGITAYMLASAAISPLANWLSERCGARNVLLGAMLTFTFASVWCGSTQWLPMFVIARVLQGFGGALTIPVGTAMVLRRTAPSDIMRVSAISIWPALVAPIIGPVLGGFITETLDWRWNFWLNLPLGLVGAAAILRFVPHDDKEEKKPLDVIGLMLCATGLTCLLAGFQLSSMEGVNAAIALGLIIGGLVSGWAAIRHLRRHPTPLLSLAPLSRPSMLYGALHPGALYRGIFATAPFLLPLLFQLGFGLSPAVAGSWVLVYFCGNLGLKAIATPILRQFGFRTVLWVNGGLVVLSILAFAFVTPDMPKLPLLILLFFAGATRSMQLTCMTSLTFADVPVAERGAASNLSAMLQQAGNAAGVAVGAFSLSLFQGFYHSPVIALPELHAAFVIIALLGLVGTFALRGMSSDLGSEVSRHRK